MSAKIRWSSLRATKAPLTEANLPDQTGKVFIVTGSSGGLGKRLASILYQRNAKVYIAARSIEKSALAIKDIKAEHPSSSGELVFLRLQLDDLTTIKKSADEFLAKESRLDVLWNNAAVMTPPQASKTVQGYELQLGTNVLGHFLFTKLLTDTLVSTAKTAPKNSVRVVWVSSSAADAAPSPAIDFSNMDYHVEESATNKYARSKAGNALEAIEFSRRFSSAGIVSVSLNPGNFTTDLQRTMSRMGAAIWHMISSDPINGAYTELFAGFHSSITKESNWVVPFGKLEEVRKDFLDADMGSKYWDWCEAQVKPYTI